MIIPAQDHAFSLKANLALRALGALLLLLLLLLVFSGYLEHLLLVVGFGIVVGIAFRFPMFTVFALLITGVLPTVYQMTPIFDASYGAIGGGLNAVDIVLMGMVGASLLRLSRPGNAPQLSLGIGVYVALFALWLLFEIVRNVAVYGISAPGEFRYRYLILSVPLYVAIFFHTTRDRKRLFRLLVFSSLIFTLLSIPIIGMLKGWSLPTSDTQEARFLPSGITVGLVYALVMLFLAHRYRYIKPNPILLSMTAIPVLFMVLIDSHRSVWLVAVVLVLSLTSLKEIRITRMWHWGVPLLLIVVIVWYATTKAGLDVSDYIATRGIAFVNPEQDKTSAWRLVQWETQISRFLSSPVAGEGFGGYWGLSGLKGDIGVSPHNLYVQTLVKLGLVGMLLYLAMAFKLLSSFKRWIRDNRRQGNPEISLVVAAFVILIGAHAYYLVYAFEYLTCLFVGLGAAVLRHSPLGNNDVE